MIKYNILYQKKCGLGYWYVLYEGLKEKEAIITFNECKQYPTACKYKLVKITEEVVEEFVNPNITT